MAFRIQWLAWAMLSAAATPSAAAVFTVTSTASSGAGTLSQAIVNANATAGADTINFNIAGAGVKIIFGGFPAITETLTINGYSQPGSAPNTAAAGATNAVVLIEIDASTLGNNDNAFEMSAPTTLRGVAIRGIGSVAGGIRVTAAGAGSSIRGCFIGTSAAGAGVGFNSGTGVILSGQAQVGGSAAADRNLISNLSTGIAIFAGGSGSTIEGNVFGTNAAGTVNLGNSKAIRSGNATVSNVRIGGTTVGSGNVIANSTINAIDLAEPTTSSAGSGNSILGNSIRNSTVLGIDLGSDGPDESDTGDADTGINGRENAPALSFARINGNAIQIFGKLDGNFTNGIKRVEYFASSSAHPSGYGEGEIFLGAVGINPTGVQVANIRGTVIPTTMPPLPFFVTATSTNFDGSTSEFSNSIAAVDGGTLRTVTNVNDSGSGSLREALTNAAAAGIDTIAFNIAGDGPHVISPTSALPLISGSTIIDGYTESFSSENFLLIGSNADLRIVLDGSLAASATGLHLTGGTSIVRGLVVQNWGNNGIFLAGGSNHRIEGNFIGTDVTGTLDRGNTVNGIVVGAAAAGVTIGDVTLQHRNLISGNGSSGINISGPDASLVGNVIGTGANGTTAIPNGFDGVNISASGGSIIGNRIRSNGFRGVGVILAGASASIRANDIFGNSGLGIDLNADGVTSNDPDDTDTGPNSLQNFPVLSLAEWRSGNQLLIQGTLDRPSGGGAQTFELDIFLSSACDNTHGEGERFLGSAPLLFVTGSPESFTVTLNGVANLPTGSVITSTVTNASGQTSEFSACLSSTVQPSAIFANGFE